MIHVPFEGSFMSHQLTTKVVLNNRYALCIGIGHYINLENHDLRFAVKDVQSIKNSLEDPEQGNFQVKLLIDPSQTTKHVLDEALYQMLNASSREAEDIVL